VSCDQDEVLTSDIPPSLPPSLPPFLPTCKDEEDGDGGGASLRKFRFFPPSLPVKRARGEKGGEEIE